MKQFLALFLLCSFINMYTPVLANAIEVKGGTPAPVSTIEVKKDTRIPITVKSEVSSKNIKAGQKIDAIIDEDVKINNVVIFKKGDKATINISEVKKAGFIGIAGEVAFVDGKVTDVKGEEHTIDYKRRIFGEDKLYPKFCLFCGVFIILAPLVLFGFVKGGQAKVYPSQIINVSIKNTFEFTPETL